MYPFTIKEDSLTVLIDFEPNTIHKSNPHYQAVVDAISAQDWEKVKENVSLAKAVKNYFASSGCGVEVKGNQVFYAGQVVNGAVVDKILAFMQKNLPVQPLINFLGRLMKNPSKRAVDELYTFLEHGNLPVLADGRFVAYKGLTADFKDIHSRTFDNRVGVINEMPRNQVDDDKDQGCSYGFHAGTWEYARDFASGGPIVTVAIDPADVVSIPVDCSCQKLRTCKYEVLAVTKDAFKDPLYKTPAELEAEKAAAQPVADDDGDEYDDQERYCHQCGNEVDGSHKYCEYCGTQLN